MRLGIDVIASETFERRARSRPEAVCNRVLATHERCTGVFGTDHKDAAVRGLAVKEAVVKVLGGAPPGGRWTDVVVSPAEYKSMPPALVAAFSSLIILSPAIRVWAGVAELVGASRTRLQELEGTTQASVMWAVFGSHTLALAVAG